MSTAPALPRCIEDRAYCDRLAQREELAPWVRGARLRGRLLGFGFLSEAEADEMHAQAVAAILRRWPDLHDFDVSAVIGAARQEGRLAAQAETWQRLQTWRLDRSAGLAAVVAEAQRPWPAEMPKRPAEAAGLVERLSGRLGVLAGIGAMPVDEAYRLAREMCAGLGQLERLMPVCAAEIDGWAAWAAAEMEALRWQQFCRLRDQARAALLAGEAGGAVRAAMVATASAMKLPPPAALLGEALAAAVAQARGDRRWLAAKRTA